MLVSYWTLGQKKLKPALKIYGVGPPLAESQLFVDDSAALTTGSHDRNASGCAGKEH